ncbi:MAG: hypothetical protein R3290_11450 [Acidimicrobiia bacterium]|nr:hypothetical protein [Acidimicrobiia bacterium]
MIRQRFGGVRSLRILSWTAVAVGWVTAVIARLAVAGTQAPAPDVPVPDPPAQTVFVPSSGTASTPALPERGLVVIRHTPDRRPDPDPVVRRVVVETTVPAPSAPAQSSGS